MYASIYRFTHSYITSFIHLLIHTISHPLAHPFIHSSVHPIIHLLTNPFFHLFIYPPYSSINPPRIHVPTIQTNIYLNQVRSCSQFTSPEYSLEELHKCVDHKQSPDRQSTTNSLLPFHLYRAIEVDSVHQTSLNRLATFMLRAVVEASSLYITVGVNALHNGCIFMCHGCNAVL